MEGSLRSISAFLLLLFVAACSFPGAETISLHGAAEAALRRSSLTLPDGKPFHLRAVVREVEEHDSSYSATIDEYWASPTKWRRTIESPEFSQTRIVDGTAVSEVNRGDYVPIWLSNFVAALFDPLPMLNALQKSDAQIPKPRGPATATTCGNLQGRVDRWVICFAGREGLLSSVFTKGYAAEFKDYNRFGNKQVARLIVMHPQPGMQIEARVELLTSMDRPDEGMFVVASPTPPDQQIRRVRLDEDTLRRMVLGSTEIAWPPTTGKLDTGGCAVYLSADRTGRVREVWPAGCDNGDLQDPLREILRGWRLTPPVSDGVPVQVEALLGFTFHAQQQPDPTPVLADFDARDLVTNRQEPVFPHGAAPPGTEFKVRISVSEQGKLTGIQNTHKLPGPVLGAIYNAVRKWQFRPYVKDGKPQYFHADLVFYMH